MVRGKLSLILIALAAIFAALPAIADYDRGRNAYYDLRADGARNANPIEWRAVAGLFAGAELQGDRPADALYMSAFCYERAYAIARNEADFSRSTEYYIKLADSYPKSNLADDGLFRAGAMFEGVGDTERAKALWRRIVEEMPDGDMAGTARKSLKKRPKRIYFKEARYFSAPTYTRVVIELSDRAEYASQSLPPNIEVKRPSRIFIDLDGVVMRGVSGDELSILDGLVTRVRLGQHTPTKMRAVLDLDADSEYRVFPLLEPYRVVIDVFRSDGDGTGKLGSTGEEDIVTRLISGANKPAKKPLRTESPSGASTKTAPFGEKRYRIVIDPGHGGSDPGAVGRGGLYEKTVTLRMAKALADSLKKRLDCDIKLTRTKDTTLSLSERTAIANGFGADLFISLHANASRSKKARGIETYYLDRSSDRSARQVAAMENKNTVDSVAETEHILADVLLGMKTPESKRLAEAVQSELINYVTINHGNVRDLGVKRAPFYVLTGAVMPSILVETAFISNPTEEKWLSSSKYGGTIAQAITQAVEKYLTQ